MPKPLEGIRILDFTWLNAGAKGPRQLAGYGAEVIRIEWKGRLDFLRFGQPQYVLPGEQAAAGAAFDSRSARSPNRAASFQNSNAGKLGISLNMHHPKGKELFRRLLVTADVVTDNYTATTLEDWGFGYDQMAAVKPDIIYVQAPGFGRLGPYRDYRTYGPIAAAVTGLTDMSGLPPPQADDPCGYGFSFLDVATPWYISLAVMSALRVRRKTGRGQHVDLSQAGPGILHTGTTLPDYSVHGRPYTRSGNRSPDVPAAPHGAYKCKGYDRWIAIACETEAQWSALVREMGTPEWTAEPRFATREARCANQDALDPLVAAWTRTQERYDLMGRLQAAGVPAGVCQDAGDRYERDPQLRARGFFAEVGHSEVGRHELEGFASRWSRTQPHPEGVIGRGAPCYAEDNRRVYGDLLGLTDTELDGLAADDVI